MIMPSDVVVVESDRPPARNLQNLRTWFSKTALTLAFLVFAMSSPTSAYTVLIDDFNDGNDDGWTHVDSNAGQPWGPGIFDPSSGAYFFGTTGIVPEDAPGRGLLFSRWDASTHEKYSEGYLRSKVRVDTKDGTAVLLFRFSGALETGLDGYVFNAIGDEEFCYNELKNTQVVEVECIPNLVPGVGEDWWLEGGAVGDQLTFKVWPDGDPEPAEPQLSIQDTSYRRGWFGLNANISFSSPTVDHVRTTFDDVYFTFDPLFLGDFDLDGALTSSDIDQLVGAIGSNDDLDIYDLNDSGAIDLEDLRIWVEELVGTHLGDADLNGEVDFADFLSLSANFGQDGGWEAGNFDDSGDVQFADFLLLSSNFGQTAAAAATVPETGTVMPTLVVACAASWFRRRRPKKLF